jgi:hypothetical protein
MEILVGTQQVSGTRAAGAYLVTVCEQLERLGHEVTVFAAEAGGPAADVGLRVVSSERGLPLAPDAIYSQDAYSALLLAELYPLTPQAFALHGDQDDLWLPPQLPGVIAVAVACDDRVVERARAAALVQEVVRLRQPVDTERFSPRGPLIDPPKSALLIDDRLSDYRHGLVVRACADAGIECRQKSNVTLLDVDVVIGRGRVTLEAMASGRAAYVYGDDGGDGWVTPERYALLEADGFSGRAEAAATDFARLRADLDEYSTEMGPANRELAVAGHGAREHAQELVGVFERLAPRRDPVDAPLRELARLVRVEAATDRRAEAFGAEAYRERERVQELELELATARVRVEELDARVAELETALAEAEQREQEAVAQRGRGVRRLLGREAKVPSTEG